MKKVLAVVLTVCVIFGAGAAFAQGRRSVRNFDGQRDMPQMQNMNRPDFEGRCPRGNFTPDMPKEIREKAVELAKLRVDLEEAMTSNPINKSKALETFKKIQLIENEIDTWKFEKRLDFMEKMKEARKNRIQKFDDDEKNEPEK